MSLYRARISEQKEAIFDYDKGIRYTYGDLEQRAQRLAWFLTHHLGTAQGDRIGFVQITPSALSTISCQLQDRNYHHDVQLPPA